MSSDARELACGSTWWKPGGLVSSKGTVEYRRTRRVSAYDCPDEAWGDLFRYARQLTARHGGVLIELRRVTVADRPAVKRVEQLARGEGFAVVLAVPYDEQWAVEILIRASSQDRAEELAESEALSVTFLDPSADDRLNTIGP